MATQDLHPVSWHNAQTRHRKEASLIYRRDAGGAIRPSASVATPGLIEGSPEHHFALTQC